VPHPEVEQEEEGQHHRQVSVRRGMTRRGREGRHRIYPNADTNSEEARSHHHHHGWKRLLEKSFEPKLPFIAKLLNDHPNGDIRARARRVFVLACGGSSRPATPHHLVGLFPM
jgi:hypothetical protein